jgi:hypothetical protein
VAGYAGITGRISSELVAGFDPEYLDDNEISKWVDYLLGNEHGEITDDERSHVQDCFECKLEILELTDIVGSFKVQDS